MRNRILLIAISYQLLASSCTVTDALFPGNRSENAESVAQSKIGLSKSFDEQQLLEEARIVKLENFGKLKITGPVIFQTGTGNSASTTGTDNTGRAASSGANGGKSEATNEVPVWALALLATVAAGAGGWAMLAWQKRKARPG